MMAHTPDRQSDHSRRPMPFARTEPLRRELAARCPSAPSRCASGTVRSCPATRARRADLHRALAHRGGAPAARPGQLGLGRAYAAGELEADDLDRVIGLLDGFQAPAIDRATRAAPGARGDAGLRADASRRGYPPASCARGAPPQPRARRARGAPPLRRLQRLLQAVSRRVDDLQLRDLLARGHHVGGGAARQARAGVHEARRCKEGERLLDVGCGWGSFVLHAAARYGVSAVGITLSPNQAELARRRMAEAGLERQGGDPRGRLPRPRCTAGRALSTRSPRSAWSSTWAPAKSTSTPRSSAGLLGPGGRLLNHGIARLRHGDPEAGAFSERYVFPDAARCTLSRVLLALERAGFEPTHVEGLRQDYVDTLSEWITRLDANLERGRATGGRRAGARVAPVPARGAQRLRHGLYFDLPGLGIPPARRRSVSMSPPPADADTNTDTPTRADLTAVRERHALGLDEARPEAVAKRRARRPAHRAREPRGAGRRGHLRGVRPAAVRRPGAPPPARGADRAHARRRAGRRRGRDRGPALRGDVLRLHRAGGHPGDAGPPEEGPPVRAGRAQAAAGGAVRRGRRRAPGRRGLADGGGPRLPRLPAVRAAQRRACRWWGSPRATASRATPRCWAAATW